MTSFNILEKEWVTNEGYDAAVYIRHQVFDSKLFRMNRLGVIKFDGRSTWYEKKITGKSNNLDIRLQKISEIIGHPLNISSFCYWHDETKWVIGRSACDFFGEDKQIDHDSLVKLNGVCDHTYEDCFHEKSTIKDLQYFEKYISFLSKRMKLLEDHICKECKRGY